MNNRPKLSIIIPVYKAERFIERCCRSLFEQTLDDIEYIFVDDCSPDNSVEIIRAVSKQYPQRESMVQILTHTPNRGVSFSRQQGLETAIGEFIVHCDSDDWVDPDMYKIMYDAAICESADVVCCGYTIEYSDGRKQKVKCMSDNFSGTVVFNLAPHTGSLCNKIVRLSNLREAEVSFPQTTNWGEDFCVSIAGLILSKKTVCIDKCFYHYWQNVESITHTITKQKCLELIKVGSIVENFVKRIGKGNEYAFQIDYCKFQCKAVLLRNKDVRDIALWRSIYPECHKNILSYSYPLYFRLAAWFVSRHLSFFAKLIFMLKDSKR